MKRANEELEEERTYTVIHTKHGIEKSIKANGTYDAAQKYAKMKGLKDTSGVNARLNEEIEETMVVTKVDKDTNSPAYQKFKAGDKRYVYKENLDLSATGDTTTSNASQEDETVELDEATFSTSQIDALKKAYGPVGPGGEKNAMQMDKLKKLMSRYPKTMLNTLAKSDIPMVSKVAKELMKEETLVEQWKFEMDIETNDDGDMILVHGNVSASSESQAQQKFDKLEKEMEKKYGQGSVEGGVFKGKNTHTSGRGPVTRKNI
jgi:hypothetical protein